jgi:dTDP-glucose pyrophosphorylase
VTEKPLQPEALLIDAIKAIEFSCRRMAIIVDVGNYLLGTLTDGDIRRHLLAGGDMNECVSKVMNTNPLSALEGSSDGYIKDLMRLKNVVAIPLLDKDKKYIRLVHLMDIEQDESLLEMPIGFSFAVIMAGGEGTRLQPLTKVIPKPMVLIDGVPLLERQIQRLLNIGLSRVYISVNYLGHIIEEYFGDGSKFGIEIRYLREQEKLGTAGALKLLPELPDGPILVMNGDILTTSDLDSLYHFHNTNSASITVAAKDYLVQIPYGVIQVEGVFVKNLIEKPSERFLCNAGIYVLSSQVLQCLPSDSFSNMTDLVEICLSKKLPVAVFPVHEYWNDIGTPDDLERARIHFSSMEINK